MPAYHKSIPQLIVKVLDLKDVVEKAVEKQRQRSLHLTADGMRELGLREGCNTSVQVRAG